MKLNAYIMLGDPSFLHASVASYYRHVSRIVVSYDRDGLSWTGTPLPLDECLARIRALDTEGKCDLRPGTFARPGLDALENDTNQRSVALMTASDGADWVLQLDTDEVLPEPTTLVSTLRRADDAGADGLEFPARWLYTRVGSRRFLESCSRLWRPASSYPGPVAVRAGTSLVQARQTDGPLYRADVRPWNTDPSHPRDAIVHEVVPYRASIVHYSWVRSSEYMRRKVGWSGHSEELKESGRYEEWIHALRHPLRTSLQAPLKPAGRRFRITTARSFLGEER
jgi:hypothetical protein